MLAVLSVEIRKLNRSLALLLAAAAPALIAVFAFAMMLRSRQPSEWDMWIGSGLAIWAYFLMPMCVTALTALIAQMEHAPRSWDHLRALPVPRWTLYASKAICVIGLVLVMSAAVLGMTVGAVVLGGMVKPEVAAVGRLDLAGYAWTLIRIAVAAVLMIAIQFWTAIRFASFVPGLVLGIGGAFFAVVATSAKQGVFMPWQMPVNILATEAWRVQTALTLGGGLGLVVLAAAVIHLARREVR
ncbi:MAG: ABC transporter permease [Brevundimonas sp.]|uniref:ABC transporter permease n=1 Tax=Brevundimonas sp. TaxID=1871086 RepID=UPI002718644D|nr:ABC transporter permease [Brevundimonas sp.]MDO9609941.1 ABC transporter permease [Brevundimonas sp.]